MRSFQDWDLGMGVPSRRLMGSFGMTSPGVGLSLAADLCAHAFDQDLAWHVTLPWGGT